MRRLLPSFLSLPCRVQLPLCIHIYFLKSNLILSNLCLKILLVIPTFSIVQYKFYVINNHINNHCCCQSLSLNTQAAFWTLIVLHDVATYIPVLVMESLTYEITVTHFHFLSTLFQCISSMIVFCMNNSDMTTVFLVFSAYFLLLLRRLFLILFIDSGI
jgi:hypothetical protein